MAMRIMNRDEFEQQLKKNGLQPTNKESVKGRLWEDSNGNCVMVPNIKNKIPDSVLDRVLEVVDRLYH